MLCYAAYSVSAVSIIGTALVFTTAYSNIGSGLFFKTNNNNNNNIHIYICIYKYIYIHIWYSAYIGLHNYRHTTKICLSSVEHNYTVESPVYGYSETSTSNSNAM